MNIAKKMEAYVASFMIEHQLLNSQNKHLVALSGGIDSVVLFTLLKNISSLQFEVIHFNHGTRKTNSLDEDLVIKLCQECNIKYHIIKLSLNLSDVNFEAKARTLRNEFYQKFIQKGFTVFTAHHLDDSFEWTLMQKFKQGSLKSTLGIPVYNRGIARPLMCLSKKQILHYAKELNLIWNEDESNRDTYFERNNMRINIINQIQKKYPNYLKHYVYQQNALAIKLQMHRNQLIIKDEEISIVDHFITGKVLISKNFSLHREAILEVVKDLSAKKRGKLNIVLDAIIRAQKLAYSDLTKMIFYGPYSFSGGVTAYLYLDRLFIFKESETKLIELFDRELSVNINSEITYGFINNQNPRFFPNLFVQSRHLKILRPSKQKFSLFHQTISKLKQSDIRYCYLSN